jgi:hypothetical protein
MKNINKILLIGATMLVTVTILFSCVPQKTVAADDPGSQGFPNLKPYSFWRVGPPVLRMQYFRWIDENTGSETATAPWTDVIRINGVTVGSLQITEDLEADSISSTHGLWVQVPGLFYSATLYVDYYDDVNEGMWENDNTMTI